MYDGIVFGSSKIQQPNLISIIVSHASPHQGTILARDGALLYNDNSLKGSVVQNATDNMRRLQVHNRIVTLRGNDIIKVGGLETVTEKFFYPTRILVGF